MSLRMNSLHLSTAIALAITAWSAFAQSPTVKDTPAKDVPARVETATPATKPVASSQASPALRAQILLERAWFSPGEIDGQWGSKSRQALAAFQQARGMKVSGKLDEASMAALDMDASPSLIHYTLTAEDVAGPFTQTPEDTQAKAAMASIPYQSSSEALGEKFHSSPALLAKLNPGVPMDVAGGLLVVPNVMDVAPLAEAAKVVVDKSESVLHLVDAAGMAYAQFPITTGSAEYPLPNGEWKIESINPNPSYTYDPSLIAGADKDDKKAELPPGPNGPVGTMWMGLSKPHYGIHGTPDPDQIGRDQSSGCVRLTNWSANAVGKAVSVAMIVAMQE